MSKIQPGGQSQANSSEPEREHQGELLRLVPQNPAAKVAFAALVEELRTTSNLSPDQEHLRQFIAIDEPQEAGQAMEDDSEDFLEMLQESTWDWEGHFRAGFLLHGRLAFPVVFGSDIGVVDLLLTSQGPDRVRGRHGLFELNPSEGILFITSPDPSKEIMVGTESVRGRRLPLSTAHRDIVVSIGNLSYKLEFADWLEEEGWEHLRRVQAKNGLSNMPPPTLTSTYSSSNRQLNNNYVMQARVGQGRSGTVFAGYRQRSFVPVALKRINRSKANTDEIDRECNILRGLHHVNIMTLITAIEKDDEGERGAVYLALYPLCHGPLSAVPEDMPKEQKLQLFFDSIFGLDHLHHERGMMHRDINPDNILFRYENDGTIRAVITDFGSAIFEDMSYEYMHGTTFCQAPEIFQLKNEEISAAREQRRSEAEPYTRKLDIFALGVTAMCLFSGMVLSRLKEVKDGVTVRGQKRMTRLAYTEGSIPGEWGGYISMMLDMDAGSRPSARQFALWAELDGFGPSKTGNSLKRGANKVSDMDNDSGPSKKLVLSGTIAATGIPTGIDGYREHIANVRSTGEGPGVRRRAIPMTRLSKDGKPVGSLLPSANINGAARRVDLAYRGKPALPTLKEEDDSESEED